MSIFSGSRIAILVIIALTAVCSILSALALTAGHRKGFLEGYDVLRINMTGIGQDLLDTVSDDSSGDSNNPISDILDKASDGVKDIVNDIAGDVIDEVTDRLGISDWYSLHVMTACFGGYTPNAEAKNPGLNITGCRDTMPNNPFNLTEELDRELSFGPLQLSLTDINWPSDIQDMVDLINKLLLALFILYVLTFSLSTLSVLCAPLAWLRPESRGLLLSNAALSGLAATCAVVSAVLITVVGTVGINKLNDKAERFGLEAERGRAFLIISWVGAGCLVLAFVGWIAVGAGRLRSRRHAKRYGPGKGQY
jgi:hypothetical protein